MSKLTRLVAAATSVCTLGLGAAVAHASPASALRPARCDGQQTSTPFSAWGDDNDYFPMPGGTFESAPTEWALSGATIVSDNETFYVDGASDTRSLSLTGDASGGAEAVSPSACVDLGADTVRMFVKSSGESGSTLHVQAIVDDPLTGLVFSFGHDIDGGAGTTDWSPTGQLLIPNLLGGWLDTANLTLVFTTTGPATWNVDDVYVDPFKSH